MSDTIRPGYIRVTEARDRLHDKAWPKAEYQYGKPDPDVATPPDGWDFYAEPPRIQPTIGGNIGLKDRRYDEIDHLLVAAFRTGQLMAWAEIQGEIQRIASDHWSDADCEQRLYHGRGYQMVNGEWKEVWYLLHEADYLVFAASRVAELTGSEDSGQKRKARQDKPSKRRLTEVKIKQTVEMAKRHAATLGILPTTALRSRELAAAIAKDEGAPYDEDATRKIIEGRYPAQVTRKIPGYFLKSK